MGRQPAKTAEKATTNVAETKNEVAIFQPPRLPYHDAIKERFDVDKGQWTVLVGAIFPAAKTIDAVVMALAYCKHRGLDVFKRPVHIVPMWSSERGEMVETIWPGISELRTTAHRTGNYAGLDEPVWGPTKTDTFTGRAKTWVDGKNDWRDIEVTVTYPEWCRITVRRIVNGQVCQFVGPKVLWVESFASIGNSGVPNKMWEERPEGQLEKCAEAAALRRAFPEEIGNELTAEEMTGRTVQDVTGDVGAVVSATSAAKDSGPPRQITQEVIPPTGDKDPPRTVNAKPEPEKLPDAEVDEPEEDENPKPQGNDAADGQMNFDEEKEPEAPHLVPGAGHTFETWAAAYIQKIYACTDPAQVYKWADANHQPLNWLHQKSPGVSAKVKKASEARIAALRPADPKEKKPAAPKDAGPPRKANNPAPTGDGGLPVRPEGHDPEEFLKWVAAMLETVTDPADLEEFYTSKIEPHIDVLMPPDRAECVALYSAREKKLEP